tara:strand:- start:3411 stop:3695 length:285 start_codon:yes stop_codon:yes gene_type:complete
MPYVYVDIQFVDSDLSYSFSSPSTCIYEFLKKEAEYPVKEFKEKMVAGLVEANNRVAQKYGFGCTDCDYEIRKVRNIPEDSNGNRIKITEMRTA